MKTKYIHKYNTSVFRNRFWRNILSKNYDNRSKYLAVIVREVHKEKKFQMLDLKLTSLYVVNTYLYIP